MSKIELGKGQRILLRLGERQETLMDPAFLLSLREECKEETSLFSFYCLLLKSHASRGVSKGKYRHFRASYLTELSQLVSPVRVKQSHLLCRWSFTYCLFKMLI